MDDEAGHPWTVLAHAYEADGEITPSIARQIRRRLAPALRHSSIWLRNGAGVRRAREDPLANAYFGGFGNNYVDNGEPKRYRECCSMPGFEIDALNGRSFVKGMVEWNLPPIRFEALGTPGFYGSWIRPAMFTRHSSPTRIRGSVARTPTMSACSWICSCRSCTDCR